MYMHGNAFSRERTAEPQQRRGISESEFSESSFVSLERAVTRGSAWVPLSTRKYVREGQISFPFLHMLLYCFSFGMLTFFNEIFPVQGIGFSPAGVNFVAVNAVINLFKSICR